MLYVSNADIDTKGLVYSRALQQTTTGCYLLIVCLIGLFAIGTASDPAAVGPMILMIIFGVFCVLYHMSLSQALDPLLNYLPKNLEAEEEALLAKEGKHSYDGEGEPSGSGAADGTNGVDGVDGADPEKAAINSPSAAPADGKKPNFFAKWIRPDIYTNYASMRSLVPSNFADIFYEPEVERDAYLHPAITAKVPLLWIPRDAAGVSRQEVDHSSRVAPMTDEDATLDEKNKIIWNEDKGRPPIYEEKIFY